MKGCTYIDWDDTVTINGAVYVRVEMEKPMPAKHTAIGRGGSPLKHGNMPWSDSQDADLIAAVSRGEAAAYVAKQMGRSKTAVTSRIHILRENGRLPKLSKK